VEHSSSFSTTLCEDPDLTAMIAAGTGSAVDLGSGAGVPGLVLAVLWPSSRWTLLDGSTGRAEWLREAVDLLGLSARVRVAAERAEVAGRGSLRGTATVVTARSFAEPAVTAECAAPLLRVGGLLLVAEPPEAAPRWPEAQLAQLGLRPGVRISAPHAIQMLHQDGPCPDRFPRRTGVPGKRPLYPTPATRST